MSEKNRDNKNRWRNVTIAFRMSPEENEELDLRVKLCGYQTRQEYIIESVLHQKVTAVGNPLMLVQFRKQLRGIEEELKRLTTLEDADEELFTPIRTMLEILNAFAEERNYERRRKEKAPGRSGDQFFRAAFLFSFRQHRKYRSKLKCLEMKEWMNW